jgi:chromate transport protein ChrA
MKLKITMAVISIATIIFCIISPPKLWVIILWVITANIWMRNTVLLEKRHKDLEKQFREYRARSVK